MRFSIVMPSYLAMYPGAAKERDGKLLRAVNSCLSQTFEDWELHIVSYGCQKTIDIIQSNIKDKLVRLWKIAHRKLWSGYPRNKGIEEAKGEFIIYLDIDDIYGDNHLQIVNEGIKSYDWVWYNDIRYKPKENVWIENPCDIRQIGQHGTSNVCHKTSLNAFWDEKGRYAHDYYFVQKLLGFSNYTKITTPEYYVCHVPGGYDL